MDQKHKEDIAAIARDFRLPRYQEIPDVGLYLEQAAKYIAQAISPLQEYSITGSMISNYVKKGLVASPVKKQYSRDQIAHLMFIALAKNVMSLDDLQLFIRLQEQTYSSQVAYEYFCSEFENVLQYVFGVKPDLSQVGMDSSDEKMMLRGTIITIARKLYLDQCFRVIAAELGE